jgi:2',3'-cyclic-nucleotide 2'-phosphodiesterase (5'-nucleotidase family)
MFRRIIGLLGYIWLLSACHTINEATYDSALVPVYGTFETSREIDSIVKPYRDSLEKSMGIFLATADVDFTVGRPSSNLGNWVADAIFANQTKAVRLSLPTCCLLNTGGLRSSLNKGKITLGDMYKLMPFDNEIVWVKLPGSSLISIENYLTQSGGEPIANALVRKGKFQINGWRDTTSSFWVITSDYLLNGGDKMTFFKDATEVVHTGKLMRDALVEEAQYQVVLHQDTTIRITWE